MTNLDNSWDASVVKLAQMGNLRAITFWLNRYLVPQGLCAQITSQQPGELLVRIICHRLPDADRLVQFIRHQFLDLNSELIRELHITAQKVGSLDLLWERSVPLQFPVQPPAAQTMSQSISPPIAIASASHPSSSGIQFTERPIPKSQPSGNPRPKPKRKLSPTLAKQRSRRLAKIQVRLQDWTGTALDQLEDVKVATGRIAWRSQRWFKGRSPEVRAMLVGGTVTATIAVGCGLQVLSQYISTPTAGLWEVSMTGDKPQFNPSSTVKAALEPVPVIRQTVQNAVDPAVTLVFASNAALGQDALYQQADLLISNLDNPLASIAPDSPSSALPSSPKLTAAKANLTVTETAADPDSEPAIPRATTQDTTKLLNSSAGSISTGTEANAAEAAEAVEMPVAHATTLDELMTNGVDVVNVAADRMVAEGVDLPQTLDLLNQKAIYPIGAGQNSRQARRPHVFEVKGQKIAILGYSDSDLYTAGEQTAGMNSSNLIEADIKAIRDQVDWVIVSYHWNNIVRAAPETSQMTLAHAAIDHGADLVVGYAPQIMQGGELYGGRAIVYSLGDTIDELNNSSSSYNTAALKVSLHERNMQIEFMPIQVQQHQSAPATGESEAKIVAYLQQASSLFDRPLRSPVTLDARLRVSLPAAPDSAMPIDPFLSNPSPAKP